MKSIYNIFKFILLIMLGLFFGVSFLIHIMYYSKIYNFSDLIPIIIIILICIVLILFKVTLKRKNIQKNKPNENKDKRSKKIYLVWHYMKYAILLLFIYTAMNFLVFAGNYEGNPTYKDNKYILINHGVIVREINKNDYSKYIDYQGRFVSSLVSTLTLAGVFLLKDKLYKV